MRSAGALRNHNSGCRVLGDAHARAGGPSRGRGPPHDAAAGLKTLATCRLNRYSPNELLEYDYSVTQATQKQATILPALGLGPLDRQVTGLAPETPRDCLPVPRAVIRRLTPGARAGLEQATIVVNANCGCSTATKPRKAMIIELGNLLVSQRIE